MIPQDFIDDLLTRVDIVEIIEPRVTLKKTGQNYSGLCPFHGEKTPSFSVAPDKQFYYCFGCHASGTALKFLMEFERLDFVAAIEMLAAKAGVEVPNDSTPESNERQQKRKSIYNILDQSAEFYQTQLKEGPGRDVAVTYLKERGLSGAIARDFGLGFAPKGWTHLYDALAKTNHEHDLLLEGGMLIEKTAEEAGDGKEKRYDRFRERIMFPIRDLRGRVIAFGGRIIGDGKPKYLNSPETPVFHKSRELYGLYEARKRNKKLGSLIVVEGYMDVVALAQHGISYAVATLGTATTTEHLERLFRMVPRVVFSFDGDNAGRAAAWKALLVALSHMSDGRTAKFLFVPDGEDPDSLVRKEGKEKFELRLEGALSFAEFFYNTLTQDVDMTDLSGKALLSKTAMALILKIPKGVFRELMLDKLGELTNLTADRLMQLSIPETPTTTNTTRTIKSDSRETREPKAKAHIEDAYGASEFAEDDYAEHYPGDDYGYSSAQPDVPMAPAIAEQAKQALSILFCVPELACELRETDYIDLGSLKGYELLIEVIQLILSEDIRSPLLLLARFEDRPEFSELKYLAEKERLLNVAQMPEQLKGILKAVNKQSVALPAESRFKQLSAKPLAELSGEEKLELLQLLKALKA